MLHYRFLFVAATLFVSLSSVADPYRFVSFNIWGNFFGNPPAERDQTQAEIVLTPKPDFIALQEMTADYWKSRLVSMLRKDYEIVGEKMGPRGANAFIPICYRRDNFELLDKGAKWFCCELDVSKGVVWVALRDRKTGERIVAFSSHFWWRTDGKGDDFIRLENARQLYAEVTAAAKRHDAAVVGGGDLNASGVSAALRELKKFGWKDAQETSPGKDMRPTWRNEPTRDSRTGAYRGVPFETAKRTMSLDHIFYTPERISAYEFRPNCSQRALDVSDHSPIIFDFRTHPESAWREPRQSLSQRARPQLADSESWWMRRFNDKLNGIQGDTPVVFLGDSITHGWEGAGVTQWKKYFAHGRYAAYNFGFGGDETAHVLWRIEQGLLDNYRAKAVVLEIGTNNTGHHPVDKEPPIDVLVGVKAVVDAILAHQPETRVILHPIFPRGTGTNDPLRMRNETVNAELAKIADGRRVIWCDFNDRLVTADGTIPSAIMPDQLHFNAAGYEIWANELLPILDRILRADPGDVIAGRYSAPLTAPMPGSRFDITGTRGKWWWANRLAEKQNQIADAGGKFDVVMLGDSITHFWNDFTYWTKGREVWEDMERTYRLLNLGYGGDSTVNLLWRLQNGELDGYRAGIFQIMIGTNNRTKPEETADGIRRIIDLISTRHPESKILLMAILPRADNAHHHAENEKVNAIIRNYADGKRVFWLDIADRFLDKAGKLKPGITVDKLHPNLQGYRLWQEAAMPKYAELLKAN